MSMIRRRLLMTANNLDFKYFPNTPLNDFKTWRSGTYRNFTPCSYQENSKMICLNEDYEKISVKADKEYKVTMPLIKYNGNSTIYMTIRQMTSDDKYISSTTINNSIGIHILDFSIACSYIKIFIYDSRGLATYVGWETFLNNFPIIVEEK